MTSRGLLSDFCHIHENGSVPIGCVKGHVKSPWADMGTGRLGSAWRTGCIQHLLMFYLLIHISVLWHSFGAVPETWSPAAAGNALLAGSSGCSHLTHRVGNSLFVLPSTFPFIVPYFASSNVVTELETDPFQTSSPWLVIKLQQDKKIQPIKERDCMKCKWKATFLTCGGCHTVRSNSCCTCLP